MHSKTYLTYIFNSYPCHYSLLSTNDDILARAYVHNRLCFVIQFDPLNICLSTYLWIKAIVFCLLKCTLYKMTKDETK